MKKYILFLLTFCYLIGSNLLYAQSGCGDPFAANYYCNIVPGGCAGDFPMTFLPPGFTDDGSCIFDGVDNNGDGIPDNSMQGCEDASAYNYNSNFISSPFAMNPSSYINTYADQQNEICVDVVWLYRYPEACNYNSIANTNDGTCELATGCDTCSGETDGTGTVIDNDADDDGVCDADEVVGCTDNNPGGDGTPIACNYDSTATDTDNSLCTYPSETYLDCDGNCNNDTDGDGVCNEIEVTGCQDNTACNYNSAATDAGSCSFPIDLYPSLNVDGVSYVDCDGNCINDTDGDGVCNEVEISGCTDGDINSNGGVACNYDETATDDDGSCEYSSCAGCLTSSACNYDSNATISAECTFPESGYDCDGNCNNDTDGDGVCDEFEIEGCQDATACNYNENATDSAECTFPDEYYLDCVGDCLNDSDGDGICDELEISGCSNAAACNYNASATDDDGSCSFLADVQENIDCNCTAYDCDGNCNNDSDGDGICDELEISGCQDNTACNYDSTATDAGSCSFPVDLYPSLNVDGVSYVDCDGNCNNDSDGDGVCDEVEITGCQDDTACNYDSSATDNDNSCTYPTTWYADTDGDGLGDPNISSNNCNAPDGYVSDNSDTCPNDPENDADGDGVCESDEIAGCTDETAICNYNENATEEDGSCVYPSTWYEDVDEDGLGDSNVSVSSCSQPLGFVLDNSDSCPNDAENDADGDGICESDEIAGCQDATACNYNENATDDDSSCLFATGCDTCSGETDGTGTVVDNDSDDDGVCDADEIAGCQDANACNYNASATDDDGSCVLLDGICETCSEDGLSVVDNDSDDDGVCDADEVAGCTDNTACNYDFSATDSDNSLCTYLSTYYYDADGDGLGDDSVVSPQTVCPDSIPADFVSNNDDTCPNDAENDADGDGICESDEIAGCQDATACNYNENATR